MQACCRVRYCRLLKGTFRFYAPVQWGNALYHRGGRLLYFKRAMLCSSGVGYAVVGYALQGTLSAIGYRV